MGTSAKGLIYVISYFQFNLDSGGAAPEKTSILGINMNNEVMKILKPAVHADCLDRCLFSKRNSSASVSKSLFFLLVAYYLSSFYYLPLCRSKKIVIIKFEQAPWLFGQGHLVRACAR